VNTKVDILNFKGHLDYDTIGLIIKKLSRLMDDYRWNLSTKKKIYCALVESLENIDKHKDYIDNQSAVDVRYASYFNLWEENKQIWLVAGNIIANSNIEKLQKHIDLINSLNESQLKDLYKETIRTGVLSEKGGAGLGLINMAKVSKNNLGYSFDKINEDFSFFTLKVIVNVVEELK